MKSKKIAIHRLLTGVPGLDAVLGGGLPEFSFNLIAGQPGSGKTTLAHQMMFALATAERPALYMTVLGEPPLKMLRYQQQYDYFENDLSTRAIRFVNLSEEALAGDFNRVMQRIIDEVTAHAPKLVFIDSFRSVVTSTDAVGTPRNNLQQFMQQLGMLMTTWQATSFLIGEYFDEFDGNPVFTVADGMIWLHQSVERNSMVRQVEIKKMRGQRTKPGRHAFRISDSGIEVFAPATGARAPRMKRAGQSEIARLGMGMPLLDEMLGGGLPAGHSLLIAGPSGSGKTAVAMAFLAEGARVGETGVLAVFEQHPSWSPDPTIPDLIEADRIGLVESLEPDLSINEILTLLLHEIRRLDAKRVVIDSLSGFELAVAPSYRAEFRESLLLLVGALKSAGVTAVLTCELEDRYKDLRFSPYGTAFLTDAIIVQRYIEVESRLRRVMAVVKVRASEHSDELREYSIGPGGIKIGQSLPDQEGLLGGRPTAKR